MLSSRWTAVAALAVVINCRHCAGRFSLDRSGLVTERKTRSRLFQ